MKKLILLGSIMVVMFAVIVTECNFTGNIAYAHN